mmetsp:Transcript_6312/g.11255  ORF Transcript_6312/g.11255 Transcript_6312/m.11255 type:complete len:384 (-) Transcript_6312:1471-2622(-)
MADEYSVVECSPSILRSGLFLRVLILINILLFVGILAIIISSRVTRDEISKVFTPLKNFNPTYTNSTSKSTKSFTNSIIQTPKKDTKFDTMHAKSIRTELLRLLQSSRGKTDEIDKETSLLTSFLPVFYSSPWISSAKYMRKSSLPLIIVIGFGKTGTTTLAQALRILGYKALHFNEILYRLFPSDTPPFSDKDKLTLIQNTIESAGRMGPQKEYAVFDDVKAITDSPVPQFYLELVHAYPKSKVILSMRVLENWSVSQQKHFGRDFKECKRKGYGWANRVCKNVLNERFEYGRNVSKDWNKILTVPESCGLMAQRYFMYGNFCVSKSQAVKRFLMHNAEVLRQIPSERLLIMDPTDGDEWNVLCPFLKQPIPEQHFPILNKS